MMKFTQYFFITIFLGCSMISKNKENFVKLSTFCPDIVLEMNYATTDNFTGVIVTGYKKQEAYLTKTAAEALCRVNNKAMQQGLRLKIFDAYRPVQAVQFFKAWALKPEDRLDLKTKFYPDFSREQLFMEGYIAEKSSHSRGSTVDLTLIDKHHKEITVDGFFDYFHESSSTDYAQTSSMAKTNRLLLKNLMESEGFRNYPKEWWHFTLNNETFPDTAFDFEVE